jgi:hypothetical protein
MDIPSNNQLIPYYPEQHRLERQSGKIAGSVPLFADRRFIQDDLLRPPDFSIIITLPEFHGPEYDADLRLKTLKINQVGLLIDIYA